jgi:DNA-binding LacI/PurR family transcriptional regulator
MTTASYVLNRRGSIGTHTRAKVLQVAKDLGYEPNVLARSLRTGSSRVVGCFLPSLSNSFLAMAVEEAQDALGKQGLSVMVHRIHPEGSGLARGLEVLNGFRGCGLMIMQPDAQRFASLVRWASSGRPTVGLVYPDTALFQCNVVMDDEEASCMATRHLLQAGHRDVAIVSRPATLPRPYLRIVGYQRALSEAGITIQADFIRQDERAGHPTPQQDLGYRGTKALFALDKPPTAIVCAHNQIGMGALLALRELGLHIPEKVSLIVFDHVEWLELVDPPLTSVGSDGRDLGATAARLLLEQLNGVLRKESSLVRLPASLISRRSVGSAPLASAHRAVGDVG